MKLVLVRHPAPEIAPDVCYGRLDMGLTDAAVRNLPKAATALAAYGVSAIRSSPALRCRMVADAVVAACAPQAPVLCVDARLQEMDFGDWEGLAWDVVPREALDRWAADPMGFAAPGGETGAAFLDRVEAAWNALIAVGEDCIVISHGGPLRILCALARGETPNLLAPTPPLGSVTVAVV